MRVQKIKHPWYCVSSIQRRKSKSNSVRLLQILSTPTSQTPRLVEEKYSTDDDLTVNNGEPETPHLQPLSSESVPLATTPFQAHRRSDLPFTSTPPRRSPRTKPSSSISGTVHYAGKCVRDPQLSATRSTYVFKNKVQSTYARVVRTRTWSRWGAWRRGV